jgi:hypothetical protein
MPDKLSTNNDIVVGKSVMIYTSYMSCGHVHRSLVAYWFAGYVDVLGNLSLFQRLLEAGLVWMGLDELKCNWLTTRVI